MYREIDLVIGDKEEVQPLIGFYYMPTIPLAVFPSPVSSGLHSHRQRLCVINAWSSLPSTLWRSDWLLPVFVLRRRWKARERKIRLSAASRLSVTYPLSIWRRLRKTWFPRTSPCCHCCRQPCVQAVWERGARKAQLLWALRLWSLECAWKVKYFLSLCKIPVRIFIPFWQSVKLTSALGSS